MNQRDLAVKVAAASVVRANNDAGAEFMRSFCKEPGDEAKIRRMLGFTPNWTLEQGIQQTIDLIASGKIVDYREPQYSNERVLIDGRQIPEPPR